MEEMKRKDDILNNQRLIEEQNKQLNDRENQYRNKITSMNDRIYNNAMKYNGFVSDGASSPKMNDLYQVKNDHEFNKRLAEMRAMDKETFKRDKSLVYERLRDSELQKEFDNKMKMDKLDHQKAYKDFLDQQRNMKIEKNTNNTEDINQQLILPSYKYPNKPIPTAKKANDGVTWAKNNHNETLINNYKNYYLGDTSLRHNPITLPVEDNHYNKYLTKQKMIYGINSNNNQDNTLAKAGNQIFA
jgi:hypothetical protein